MTLGRKALPLHPFSGTPHHLPSFELSHERNEQPGQDLLEVKVFLISTKKYWRPARPRSRRQNYAARPLFAKGVDSPVQITQRLRHPGRRQLGQKPSKPKDSLYTYRGRNDFEGAKATIPLRSTDDHSTQGQTESGSQGWTNDTRCLTFSAQWERVNALIVAPRGGQDHDSA